LAESYDGDIVRYRISEDELLSKYGEGSDLEAATGDTEQTETLQDTTQNVDEETIPLTEERLDVSTNVQEREATITKKPVTETKTVEVPVTHEEVSIERRPPSGGEGQVASEGPISSTEEISIPLKKEEVEVNKNPYAKEEVKVTKRPVNETTEVREEVTFETIDTKGSK
jgi:uncharacterized protein (TIGR02271 family)